MEILQCGGERGKHLRNEGQPVQRNRDGRRTGEKHQQAEQFGCSFLSQNIEAVLNLLTHAKKVNQGAEYKASFCAKQKILLQQKES